MSMCSGATPPTGPELCKWLNEVSILCLCDVCDTEPVAGQIMQWQMVDGKLQLCPVDLATAQFDCSFLNSCDLQDLSNVAGNPNNGDVWVFDESVGLTVPRSINGLVCAALPDCELEQIGNVAPGAEENDVLVYVNGNWVPRDLSGFICSTVATDCPGGGTVTAAEICAAVAANCNSGLTVDDSDPTAPLLCFTDNAGAETKINVCDLIAPCVPCVAPVFSNTVAAGGIDGWQFTGDQTPVTFPVDGSSATIISTGTPTDPSEVYSADFETWLQLTAEECLDGVDPTTPIEVTYSAVHTGTGDQAYEIHLPGSTVVATNSPAAPTGGDSQSMQVPSGTTVNEFVTFSIPLADLLAGVRLHTHSVGQPVFPNGEIVDNVAVAVDLSALDAACGDCTGGGGGPVTVDDVCAAIASLTPVADCATAIHEGSVVTADCTAIPYTVVTADAQSLEWNDQNPGWIDPTTVPEWAELRLCNGHTGSEIWRNLQDTQGVLQWHQGY